MNRYRRTNVAAFISSLICIATFATGSAAGPATLSQTQIDARGLKTLHYLENAHSQLEEWSLRLLARLERGLDPRQREPVLDGRADLQVQKIAVTYARYAKNPALSATLGELAHAHEQRLAAVKDMVTNGPDRGRYEQLDARVQALVKTLNDWRQER